MRTGARIRTHARAYLPQSGQLWSADVHGGVVLSNIVTFNDVLEGMLCVGGAAHRIVCLDINGSTIWNTFGGGGAGDYVTVLSSARGGSSLVSGAFDLCLHTIYHSPA